VSGPLAFPVSRGYEEGMATDSRLIEYYARRAGEYDRIYQRPERQADLAELAELVCGWARGERILELACGTGWWTERLARVAEHVVATDASPEVLEAAAARTYAPAAVELRRADALRPESIEGSFSAVVAGFFLSHLPRAEVAAYLEALALRVEPAGRVILFDNRFVQGSSTPLSRRDEAGDTWQVRRLEDGGEFEVRKNFFDADELRGFVPGDAVAVEVRELTYYWASRWRVGR
jgi:demethylmenaquinone methyltransferase/2-methoxy-6-polyprenyl-1,4-benzoquinol methylase